MFVSNQIILYLQCQWANSLCLWLEGKLQQIPKRGLLYRNVTKGSWCWWNKQNYAINCTKIKLFSKTGQQYNRVTRFFSALPFMCLLYSFNQCYFQCLQYLLCTLFCLGLETLRKWPTRKCLHWFCSNFVEFSYWTV